MLLQLLIVEQWLRLTKLDSYIMLLYPRFFAAVELTIMVTLLCLCSCWAGCSVCVASVAPSLQLLGWLWRVCCQCCSVLAAVGLAVACVLLFLVGVVGGFAARSLVGYCCARTRHRKPHPPLPAPVYEDVDITIVQRTAPEELKLSDNVAYGHCK